MEGNPSRLKEIAQDCRVFIGFCGLGSVSAGAIPGFVLICSGLRVILHFLSACFGVITALCWGLSSLLKTSHLAP